MRIFAGRERLAALAALAFVVLNPVGGSTLFLAAYDFDFLVLGTNPGALPRAGADAAGLLRWAGLVDMAGYLALAPVVLHLHGRFAGVSEGRGGHPGLASMVTAAGLGFAIVGALGAVLMASAGAALLEGSAARASAEVTARAGFGALGVAVYVGIWGALGQTLLGSWLLGTAWFVRGEGRAFAALGAVPGFGALAYGLRTGLSGRTPAELTIPLDSVILVALGLVVVWALWLSLRLWRGR
jgi:hypothetical protein